MFADESVVQLHIEMLVNKYSYRKLPAKLAVRSHELYIDALTNWLHLSGDADRVIVNENGMVISHGYERVVVGNYGAYIECKRSQMNRSALCCQKGEEYRFRDEKFRSSVKYYWYTTKDSTAIKIYHQQRTVTYADYLPEHFYISVYGVFPKSSNACR